MYYGSIIFAIIDRIIQIRFTIVARYDWIRRCFRWLIANVKNLDIGEWETNNILAFGESFLVSTNYCFEKNFRIKSKLIYVY